MNSARPQRAADQTDNSLQANPIAPVAPHSAHQRTFRAGGVLLVLLFSAIYWLTLDNGLQPYELHGGDLITHQYAQVQARPGNAPGYPLFTMGGWLWFHGWRALLSTLGETHPNPIPVLSSYSTIWAVLALWLLYAICGQIFGTCRRVWFVTAFSFLLATFFGLTYFFWYYATTTEQYSSAVAQTLAIVYLYSRWDRAPARSALLYALAFLCGVSLAHMLTVALIVPPLVAVVLWRDPSLLRSPRAVLLAVLAAALPLLSYVYVYVRGALYPAWWGSGHWDSPQAWFWSFVSTAQGRDELAWAFEPGRPFFGNGFPETMWQELSLPLFVLGVVGISRLPRRHALMLYGTLFLYVVFCWLYRFGNWFQVVIPAYPLILLGVVAIFRDLTHAPGRAAQFARPLVLVALLASIVWRFTASMPAANSRDRAGDTALDRAAILLDQPLPTDARLFAAVDDNLAISYLTELWGLRPDIKTLTSGDANDDLSDGDTVYATFDAVPTLLRELDTTVALDGFSPDWIALHPRAALTTSAGLAGTPSYTVTPDLVLAAYSAHSAPDGAPVLPAAEPALDVTLTWHLPNGEWPAGVAISLRPTQDGMPQIDPITAVPRQIDRARPLENLWFDTPISYNTEQPVVLHDTYRLPQAPSPKDRTDGLLLILYRQTGTGFENIAEIQLPLPAP